MAMPKLVVECARGRDALVDLKGVPNIGPDDVAKNDEPQAGPCDVFAAGSDDLTAPRVRFGGSEICGVDRHLEVGRMPWTAPGEHRREADIDIDS